MKKLRSIKELISGASKTQKLTENVKHKHNIPHLTNVEDHQADLDALKEHHPEKYAKISSWE